MPGTHGGTDDAIVDRIEGLFVARGHRPYDGQRREPVTALAHALQCAQLAESAGAEPALVAAALLHDIGHLLADGSDDADDGHELRAVPFLAAAFGPAVVEPVRLHVRAKRYLVASDPAYAHGLTPASRHSLALQGGAMGADEMRAFVDHPYAQAALQLRRWDDAAKQPARATPPLGAFLPLLRGLQRRG